MCNVANVKGERVTSLLYEKMTESNLSSTVGESTQRMGLDSSAQQSVVVVAPNTPLSQGQCMSIKLKEHGRNSQTQCNLHHHRAQSRNKLAKKAKIS